MDDGPILYRFEAIWKGRGTSALVVPLRTIHVIELQMIDPLSPLSGVWPRLLAALVLCAFVWAGVAWSLA